MTSIVAVNEKICSIDTKNAELMNKIKSIQEQIDFNNKKKSEIQGQPIVLDLSNEKEVDIAINKDKNNYYKKPLDKALKYHKLLLIEDGITEDKVVLLASNKRLLKSTLSVLITIIKTNVVIKVELKGKSFYIRKTDNLKVGIFEDKNKELSVVKTFFSVKQAMEYLNLI
jgi:hypothetical protein